MPKVESKRISVTDGEVLEKVAVVAPTKVPAKIPTKGKTAGVSKNSIPPQALQAAKRRSVLEVDKYGPDESSRWKRVNARFPNLYKALLDEPDRATRVARLKQAVGLTG